jgi:hypothetical protein
MGESCRIDNSLSQRPTDVLAMLILVNCASFRFVSFRCVADPLGKEVMILVSGLMHTELG